MLKKLPSPMSRAKQIDQFILNELMNKLMNEWKANEFDQWLWV